MSVRISGRFLIISQLFPNPWYGRTASCVSYCMVCPNCNSTDMKKLSLIYAAGVYESRGRIGGLLFGSGDGFFFGKSRGTSQNRLSAMLRPPRKAPYLAPAIFWVISLFIVMAFAGREKLSWAMGALAVSHLLALPTYLLAALVHNFFVRPKKYKDWNEQFICQRCGAHSRIREGVNGVALEALNRESAQ
jgi:hypothetical protein